MGLGPCALGLGPRVLGLGYVGRIFRCAPVAPAAAIASRRHLASSTRAECRALRTFIRALAGRKFSCLAPSFLVHLPLIAFDRLAEHAGTDRVTGSRSAGMRSALVDYFRERGRIMIATEAGAEGINLQFCALVVNYDLPWNPQRIEQRVGRCHRYGQTHDVVVVNRCECVRRSARCVHGSRSTVQGAPAILNSVPRTVNLARTEHREPRTLNLHAV